MLADIQASIPGLRLRTALPQLWKKDKVICLIVVLIELNIRLLPIVVESIAGRFICDW